MVRIRIRSGFVQIVACLSAMFLVVERNGIVLRDISCRMMCTTSVVIEGRWNVPEENLNYKNISKRKAEIEAEQHGKGKPRRRDLVPKSASKQNTSATGYHTPS